MIIRSRTCSHPGIPRTLFKSHIRAKVVSAKLHDDSDSLRVKHNVSVRFFD